MATTFNLRLDEQLKTQSFDVIESFGLTPSQFMRLVLKQVADTGSLPLSFDRRLPSYHQLTPQAQERLRQSQQEFANGDYTSYSSLDELNQAVAELGRD